jgi:vacuolar-type H+-ATPase subunit B/Vma2
MSRVKTFNDFLNESSLNEAKSDYMGSYDRKEITIKRGYKHATEDELYKMYEKIGKLLKQFKIPVKSVTVITEGAINEKHDWSDEVGNLTVDSLVEKAKDIDEGIYTKIEELIAQLIEKGL